LIVTSVAFIGAIITAKIMKKIFPAQNKEEKTEIRGNN
jgi:hypothetical protein